MARSKNQTFALIFFSLLFILLIASGCNTNSPQEKTTIPTLMNVDNTSTPENKPIPEPSSTPDVIFEQEATPVIPKATPPSYEIRVVFDYLSQSANIEQNIKYINNSSFELSEIRLACDTLRYPNSFSIQKVTIDNGKDVETIEEDYYLSILLEEPLQPGSEIEIQMDYLLKVPPLPPPADDKKPGIFGYSAVQTNFVDWYPFIPPLDKEGNLVLHEPWFYGEYLVYDLADFKIEIELVNTLPDTQIAASTLPKEQDENFYIYESNSARNFVWSVSPSYIVDSINVDGITITTYSFPFHQQAGTHVLKESAKAIELYSKLFSDYPRENLTIVEGDFLDGMEYDGLFFLGRGYYNLFDNTPQNYLTFIAAHETAHQWWYSSVANDQAIEPWLDEALCTYSEILFYEEYYPELMDWWWEYRVNYYQPDGIINKPIYDYTGFIPYRNATYLQGAKFLENLRKDIGDSSFFELIKEYATSQQNEISSEEYFLQLIENYSGQNPITTYPEFFQNRE
jgi:hypothetical protein